MTRLSALEAHVATQPWAHAGKAANEASVNVAAVAAALRNDQAEWHKAVEALKADLASLVQGQTAATTAANAAGQQQVCMCWGPAGLAPTHSGRIRVGSGRMRCRHTEGNANMPNPVLFYDGTRGAGGGGVASAH